MSLCKMNPENVDIIKDIIDEITYDISVLFINIQNIDTFIKKLIPPENIYLNI